jgi:CRISPR-associated protein Csx17
VRAFLETDAPRLAEYRTVISLAVETLQACGLTDSSEMQGEAKYRYLARLRSSMPDRFIDWLDAATVLEADKPTYSVLVGTTGGSDGNTHLSDNFMKNLWDLLPEFDPQRPRPRRGQQPRDTLSYSKALLSNALFGTPVRGLSDDKTASLYDPGATGGANAGQGMERGPLLNPWNYLLCLEGCISLAGSVARRFNATSRSSATFPFQVQLSAGGAATAAQGEQTDREVWLPLWSAPATYPEVGSLLGEGRVTVGREVARRGIDVARAVAELGVDRGISSFQRFGIIRSRVGGDRYSTAVPLGRFAVRGQRDAELLHEVSGWLESFRTACRTKAEGAKKDPPARFPTALRRIDSAMFDFCKYGGRERLRGVLCALGNAERELSVGDMSPARRLGSPASGLSSDWSTACHDGTREYRLAQSVAAIQTPTGGKLPSLRAYLEPVERKGWGWQWTENAAFWSERSLAGNLGAVLSRRLMEAERAGEEAVPLLSALPATLADISCFLSGSVDDARIEELLWGLVLVDQPSARAERTAAPDSEFAPPLSRAYALLKLSLLPGRLAWVPSGTRVVLRHVRSLESGIANSVRVRPEPSMLARLRAGDTAGACEVAIRRLRAAGYVALPGPNTDGSRRPVDYGERGLAADRLLASLLFPIHDDAVDTLAQMVLRVPSADAIV